MITSKQGALIGLAGLAALFAIASTQAACSSNPVDPVTTPGAAGTHTGAGGAASGGSAPAAGGSASAGAPAVGGGGAAGAAAGAPAVGGGGAGVGGGPLGTGGGSAGSGTGGTGTGGNGSGGSAGHSAAGAGGGGSTPTYAEIKTIFSASCTTSKCHDSASGHTNFKDGELYTTLTTALPATAASQMCEGTILAPPGNAAGSFLVKLVTGPGQSTCQDAGKDSKVDRMPDRCGTTGAPACLTAAQIKTLTDWIAGNAPH